MGQTLSEPVVEKHTDKGASDRFAYAISEMQGWRITMEDAHATILSLPPAPSSDSSSKIPSSNTVLHPAFFAVYDGHGGSNVAKYTGKTLHERLSKLPTYASGDYEAAMRRAFLATDEDLRSDPDFFDEPSGCTAVAVLITPDDRLICANAGDSRAIVVVGGKQVPLSHDHKPTNKEELERIQAGGGFVEFGRVNGNLALSRAVGDFEFKQNYSLDAEHQVVTVNPDIIVHQMTGEEEFIVVACDGIWDCLTSQQVADFTRRAIANGDSLEKVCEDMMEKCLAPDSELGGVGCDNMTVSIVAVLGGRSLEEWAAWVKKRVEEDVGYKTPLSVPDVFKAPPIVRGSGGASSAAASTAATVGSAINTAGSRMISGGRMMANGMTLQDILMGTGIQIPGLTDRMGDDEESEEESSEDGEPSAMDETNDVPSGPSKSGSVSLMEDDDESTPLPTSTSSSAPVPVPAATGRGPTTASPASGIASVGSPLVPTHPELQRGVSPPKST